jgi:hypothetical protein
MRSAAAVLAMKSASRIVRSLRVGVVATKDPPKEQVLDVDLLGMRKEFIAFGGAFHGFHCIFCACTRLRHGCKKGVAALMV